MQSERSVFFFSTEQSDPKLLIGLWRSILRFNLLRFAYHETRGLGPIILSVSIAFGAAMDLSWRSAQDQLRGSHVPHDVAG